MAALWSDHYTEIPHLKHHPIVLSRLCRYLALPLREHMCMPELAFVRTMIFLWCHSCITRKEHASVMLLCNTSLTVFVLLLFPGLSPTVLRYSRLVFGTLVMVSKPLCSQLPL